MIKKYDYILYPFLILSLLLGSMYACAPRAEDQSFRRTEPEAPGVHNLTIEKPGPPRPAMTMPRGDEHVATFFQQKLNDPEGKKDACKQYILTFTQDKVLWNWVRQNC
jgi:hypothetical protein